MSLKFLESPDQSAVEQAFTASHRLEQIPHSKRSFNAPHRKEAPNRRPPVSSCGY